MSQVNKSNQQKTHWVTHWVLYKDKWIEREIKSAGDKVSRKNKQVMKINYSINES